MSKNKTNRNENESFLFIGNGHKRGTIVPFFNITVISYSIIEQLGGKQCVMHLLSHDDPNVRYEALLAVQKLMVHNWYVFFKYFVYTYIN